MAYTRKYIEAKFGSGGVKGFKGRVTLQKSQENARRARNTERQTNQIPEEE